MTRKASRISTPPIVTIGTVDASRITPPKSKVPGCAIISSSKGPSSSPEKKPISQIGQVLGEVFK